MNRTSMFLCHCVRCSYRQIEEEGDDGALDSAADEGKQARTQQALFPHFYPPLPRFSVASLCKKPERFSRVAKILRLSRYRSRGRREEGCQTTSVAMYVRSAELIVAEVLLLGGWVGCCGLSERRVTHSLSPVYALLS